MISFKLHRKTFLFYLTTFLALSVFGADYLKDYLNYRENNKLEKRVIQCSLFLNKGKVQKTYFVANNSREAKEKLFNAKNGLYFDNTMYIKTTDFEGKMHIVPFSKVECDSVGMQVSQI